jgi:glycosyltransferase involved in cell wall biosynthesis
MEGAVAMGSVRVSVVIPTLNEAENLPHVLPRFPAGLYEVILVSAAPAR